MGILETVVSFYYEVVNFYCDPTSQIYYEVYG